MHRILTCLFASFVLAAAALPAPRASAQEANTAGRDKAVQSQFADLYQRWQQAQDPEQRIALGEQLIALEGSLTAWPLEAARDRVKADIRFNLGIGYLARVQGVRADDQETAIAHFEAALQAWTRESDPQNWGNTHNNLAIAFMNRIRGARSDNQESAIAHLEAAQTVLSRDAYPQEWGQIQNNLAVVYLGRARGDRAENLHAAVQYFALALEVFTRETDPHRWATTQHNLAAAYGSLKTGDRSDNQDKEIEHYEAALTVFTHEASPQDWATTQQGLAIAYSSRIRGERADNQDKAIQYFEASLSVFTRAASPENWAQLQHNIGIAYAGRVQGERADNWQKAIAAYQSALSIFTREAFPLDQLRTSQLLARAYLETKDLQKAGQAYASARDAFLLLFGQGLDEGEARSLLAEAGPLFAEAAFAALLRGEPGAALELANEGRARQMAVALKLQTLELPAAKRRRLDDLRVAIRAARQAADTAEGTERAAAIDKLVALRQELLGLVKSSSQGRSGGALAEARSIAAAGGAVVMPVITGHGAKIMIVAKAKAKDNKDLTVIDLPELTTQRLSELLIGSGDQPAGWIAAYFIQLLEGDEFDSRWPDWLAAIDSLGPELWGLFGGRLDAALKERGVKPGARVVWLPSGWLGTLPLGLAQDPATKRRLVDDYEIAYAPNLEALAAAYRHPAMSAPATLAAVINPTGDLSGAQTEGTIVASHFASGARTLLEGQAATPDAVLAALKGRTHWHFASHGTFSWSDARQSALLLHGRKRLSVGQLLETDGLGRPRLVVLSACETGLFEITSNPDEFIGLPAAFTALGAAGVLGTLWPVSDTATALLIAKFYELHIGARLPPATALHRAQSWLRGATNRDLQAYAKGAAARNRIDGRQLAEIEEDLSPEGLARSRNRAIVQWIGPDGKPAADQTASGSTTALARPYVHPYWWAGFIHTGL